VVAGGEAALVRAIEGAEDHAERAVFALQERGLAAGDVIVAISASGRTPFTMGSLDAAHEVGARTVGITCNPGSPLAEAAEIAIVPRVGPEVIAGSTRMKGGLAQKMVLNMLSTAVMVRLGYVQGNLMTHLLPASEKLRERGLRIVMQVGGLGREEAEKLLNECEGNVAEASRRLHAEPREPRPDRS
jgi:N-acetylmuramic acid 6-phosphate etherase